MNPGQPDVISAGPRRARPVWVIVVVFAAALAAAIIAALYHHGHPRPLTRITACGHGLVPGYGNHRSYPSGIPTLPPPAARIAGCFASLAQAEARGFALPVPRGTVIVHGVFLLPTGPLTRRQCQAAGRAAGYPVPCPAVAPALASTPLRLPDCSDGGGCSLGRSGFTFTEDGFAAPPDYHSGLGGPGFMLLASRMTRVTNECPPRPAIMRLEIGGDDAAVFPCPPYTGDLDGDVVLAWVHQGVHVVVGFHGVNPANIALDLAVARHLAWVGPRLADGRAWIRSPGDHVEALREIPQAVQATRIAPSSRTSGGHGRTTLAPGWSGRA
jgi:hypothetical protein